MTQSAPGWHPDPAGRFAQLLGEDPFGTIEAGPGGGVAFIGLVMVAVGSALPSPRRA